MKQNKAVVWLASWLSMLVLVLAACSSTPAPQETLESQATLSYTLFYKSDGTGAFGSFDTSGNYVNLRNYTTFSPNWSHIVKTSNGVFFYKTSDGSAAFGKFSTTGNFTQLRSYPAASFATGWTQIVYLPTKNLVFFYRASDGVAATGSFDSNGTFTQLQTQTFSAG